MRNHPEASTGKQRSVGLIDGLISLVIVSLVFVTGKPSLLYQLSITVNSTILVIILFSIHRLLALMLFNQTIGMRLLKVVLLNGDASH